ncbi:trihelix transcription factor ASIL2-like [Phoenix dactylifera]|uniref:Trihelix transcription factor ASIL2-like n=1 Tax=Phoenix dactylifera TaxID=42345 RepID=A0A8B9AGQ2_PHODC|nr:trihelix transcription factor ASIL2-like [Phoenix dactylifera]XP_038982440.1 trihelix transcription factor ASIL2-like [Phoenix dactylifera]
MPPFSHLLRTPTTTASKPSSLMASSSSAAADASKDPPSSPAPTPSAAAATAAAADGAAVAASLSPSPSPARSPSPLPLPAPHAAAPVPLSSASSRRLPPPCWTHEETLALIDSYRDKWYALRRGNLRASHWQEVADAVARRCSRLPQASSKTSVQCRHKVEKLRKRYRAERQRSLAHDPSTPPTSSWIYFRKMDAMEHGGASSAPYASASAASRPSPSPAPPRSRSDEDEDDDEDEEDDEDDGGARAGGVGSGNTRSLHRLMANGGGIGGGLRFTIPKAVRSKITTGSRIEERAPVPSSGGVMNPSPTNRFFRGYGGARPAMEEMRRRLEKSRRRRKRDSPDAVGEMVSALRTLGDGFLRMEQMKVEMAREMEKVRMEMELKRTEMILDSQRRIVDAFVKGFFRGKKRSKVSPEA